MKRLLITLVFVTAFAATAFGQFFEPPVNYAATGGAAIMSVVISDLDGDNDNDIVSTNQNPGSNDISVFLNNGVEHLLPPLVTKQGTGRGGYSPLTLTVTMITIWLWRICPLPMAL